MYISIYIFIFTYIHIYIYIYISISIYISKSIYILIDRNPPPGGCFFVGRFPNENPGEKGPPLKKNFLGPCFRGGPLLSDSSFGNHPTKKPPRGGGLLLINTYIH